MTDVRLLVIPPSVPDYRTALYDALADQLPQVGVELLVVASPGPPSERARGDARIGPWAISVSQDWRCLRGREVGRRHVHEVLSSYRPTHVIVEHALRNVETYGLMARQVCLRSPRIGMWGHGDTFTKPQSRSEQALKRALTRRADWFFAYTEEGGSAAVRAGVSPERLTVLYNTVDVEGLRRSLASLTASDIDAYEYRLGLTRGRTALYLGSLDEDKRVEVLVGAAEEVSRRLPGFSLVVAGDGSDAHLVHAAISRGLPIRFMGRLRGRDKALAISAATVLVCPGRVGLVAVDALGSGRPLLTTDFRYHAPEFAYLSAGRTMGFSASDPSSFARLIIQHLSDEGLVKSMGAHAWADGSAFTLNRMVEQFTEGVTRWTRGDPDPDGIPIAAPRRSRC